MKLKITHAKTIVLLSCMLLMGCDYFMDPEARMEKAINHLNAGENSAAIIELKKITQANPSYLDAKVLLAEAWLKTGASAAAEYELRDVLDQLGKRGKQDLAKADKIILLLGRAMLARSRYKELISENLVERMGTKEGRLSATLLNGHAYMALQSIEEAKATYHSALKIDGKSLDALIGLAYVAQSEDNVNAAFDYLARALAIDPNNSNALFVKGELEFRQKNLTAAESSFLAALSVPDTGLLAEQHFLYLVMLAEVQLQLEKFEAVIKTVDGIDQKLQQAPQVQHIRAVVAYRQGDNNAALALLEDIFQRFPEYEPIYALLGTLYFNDSEYQKAQRLLDRAVEYEPNKNRLRKMLALSQIRSNQAADALTSLLPLKADSAEDPGLSTLLGVASLQSGDVTSGIAYLEQSVEKLPENEKLQLQLAQAYVHNHQYDEALSKLAFISDEGEIAYQKKIVHAYTLIKKKTFKEAGVVLEVLIEGWPNEFAVHALNGFLQLSQKKLQQSYAAFQKTIELNPDYLPAHMVMAKLALQDSKMDSAKKHLNAILLINPKHTQSMVILASLAEHEENSDDAIKWLQRAADTDSESIQIKLLLFKSVLKTGKILRCKQLLNSLYADSRLDQHELNTLTTQLVSETKSSAPELDSLNKRYEWLLEVRPKNYIALNNLAWHYHEQGNQKGLELAHRAHKLKPDLGSITDTLGWILVEQGKVEEGLQVLAKAVEQAPKNPDILFHFASAQAKAGNKDKARGLLDSLLKSEIDFASRQQALNLKTSLGASRSPE